MQAPYMERLMPKFPHITVKLIGQDGNAFNLLGIMQRELRRNGVAKEDVDAFIEEATSGDYDHLLQTCTKTVNVA
jgi:hypothetical protein